MIPQQEDLNGMLEEMLNTEPENRFYRSLQKQYHESKTLTQPQIKCLQKDYKEKINKGSADTQKRGTDQVFGKCSLCGADIKTKVEGTETKKNGLLCLRCFDKPPEKGKDEQKTQKYVAPATATSVLIDTRNRTKEQLETEYGPITQASAMYLWNDHKISYREYEQFIDKEKEKEREKIAEEQRKTWEETEQIVEYIEDTPLSTKEKEEQPCAAEDTNTLSATKEKCILQHPHAGPHKYVEDATLTHDTYENWKNSTPPAPKTISQQPSIEDFIQNFLSSPDYGTREEITDIETIKAILSLIKDCMVRDCSHYHGYNPEAEAEAKYQKTTLEFKNEQLFKNGVALDCRLNDPQFTGMRINNNKDSFGILLDFYHPEHGYTMKCINFDVRREGVWKEKQKTRDRNTVTTNKEAPAKPIQEEKNPEKEQNQKKLF